MVGDKHLSRSQIIKGLVLLSIYIVSRSVIAQLFGLYKGFTGEITTTKLVVVVCMFVFGTTLLVYVGFTKWVGVNLSSWFFHMSELKKDIALSIVGTLVIFIVNSIFFALTISLGWLPLSDSLSYGTITKTAFLMSMIFSLLVVAPQEEILFRGFLQTALEEKFSKNKAVVMQALVFAVSYLGFYPITSWYFVSVVFIQGIIWGLIRKHRKTLLPSFLSHAIVG